MHGLNLIFTINNLMSSLSSGTLINAEESKVTVIVHVPQINDVSNNSTGH